MTLPLTVAGHLTKKINAHNVAHWPQRWMASVAVLPEGKGKGTDDVADVALTVYYQFSVCACVTMYAVRS